MSTRVPIPGTNESEEFTSEDDLFKKVSENLSERFRLALSASVCSGKVFDDIGFLGNTESSQQVLKGTCTFLDDTDPVTRLLLEEAAITYSKLTKKEVASYMIVDDFQYYWQRANEISSSSFGGLHMGHYKVAIFDPELSALHACKLSLTTKTGLLLNCWGKGVTALLEKYLETTLYTN